MKYLNYLFENVISAKRTIGAVMVILAAILILIWPIFYFNGWNTPDEKVVEKDLAYVSGVLIGLICLIYLPVKRHEAEALNYQTDLKNLRDENNKLINDFRTDYLTEIGMLKGEIHHLKAEKEKASQVFPTAAMIIDDNGPYKLKLIKIKVVNKTDKKIWVEKVSVFLEPHVVKLGGVAALRSDLTTLASPHSKIEIDSGGNSAYWQLNANSEIKIQSYQIDGKWQGQGKVILSDEREFVFHFDII